MEQINIKLMQTLDFKRKHCKSQFFFVFDLKTQPDFSISLYLTHQQSFIFYTNKINQVIVCMNKIQTKH